MPNNDHGLPSLCRRRMNSPYPRTRAAGYGEFVGEYM